MEERVRAAHIIARGVFMRASGGADAVGSWDGRSRWTSRDERSAVPVSREAHGLLTYDLPCITRRRTREPCTVDAIITTRITRIDEGVGCEGIVRRGFR